MGNTDVRRKPESLAVNRWWSRSVVLHCPLHFLLKNWANTTALSERVFWLWSPENQVWTSQQSICSWLWKSTYKHTHTHSHKLLQCSACLAALNCIWQLSSVIKTNTKQESRYLCTRSIHPENIHSTEPEPNTKLAVWREKQRPGIWLKLFCITAKCG